MGTKLLSELEKVPAFKARANRPWAPRSIEVYPGVPATDERWLALQERLWNKLPEVFPSGEWDRFGSIPGEYPVPAGVPLPNALEFRKDSVPDHVHVHPTPRHMEVIRKCARVYAQPGEPRAVRLKRGANNGIPDLTSSEDFRREYVETWYRYGNRMARMIDRLQWPALGVEYKMILAYVNAYRLQPDKVKRDGDKREPKRRVVMNYKGVLAPTDKRSPVSFRFFSSRSRQVAMASQAPFFPLRVLNGVLDGHRYQSKVFKLAAPDSFLPPIVAHNAVSVWDVANHDQQIPLELLHAMIDQIATFVEPWVTRLLLASYGAPLLAFSDVLGEAGWQLYGDLDDPLAQPNAYVNPSGHPLTSFLASFAAFCYLLIAADEYATARKIPTVDPLDVFEDRAPFLARISGDNVALGTNDTEWTHFVEDFGRWSTLGTVEPTETYLGYLIKPGSWAPSIPSYAINITCGVERDYRQREFWALGFFERKAHFSRHPAYHDIDAAVQEAFVSNFGMSLEDMARQHYVKPDIENLDLMAQRLLADPTVIYKYPGLEDLLDHKILARMQWTLAPDQLRPFTTLIGVPHD